MARQHIHPNSNGKFYRIHEDTNTSIYIFGDRKTMVSYRCSFVFHVFNSSTSCSSSLSCRAEPSADGVMGLYGDEGPRYQVF